MIKRFHMGGYYNLREKLSGDLVLYDDHLAEIAKKEAEIAALKPEIARLKNQVAEAVNVSLLFREGEKV